MIVGLGIAAELVSKNLSLYKDHMMEMRNLLEHLLNVRSLFLNQILCIFNINN